MRSSRTQPEPTSVDSVVDRYLPTSPLQPNKSSSSSNGNKLDLRHDSPKRTVVALGASAPKSSAAASNVSSAKPSTVGRRDTDGSAVAASNGVSRPSFRIVSRASTPPASIGRNRIGSEAAASQDPLSSSIIVAGPPRGGGGATSSSSHVVDTPRRQASAVGPTPRRAAGDVPSSSRSQQQMSPSTSRHASAIRFRSSLTDSSIAGPLLSSQYGGGAGSPTDDSRSASMDSAVERATKEELARTYTENISFFTQKAEEEKQENRNLTVQVGRLERRLEDVEQERQEVDQDTNAILLDKDVSCKRQLLTMRKTLILSEQTAGSLRAENDALANRSNELELVKDQLAQSEREKRDLEQRVTLLAQQNSALQRALKQRDTACNADLDVYIKQLDLVQSQNDQLKKEAEILSIEVKQQQALEREIERLQRQCNDLQRVIEKIDREASQMQQTHAEELQQKDDDCAREIVNYRRHVVSLEKQVEHLGQQNHHLLQKSRQPVLEAEIATLQGRLRKLAEVVVELETQNTSLQSKCKQNDERLSSQEEALETLQRTHRQQERQLKHTTQERDELEAELQDVKKKLSATLSYAQEKQNALRSFAGAPAVGVQAPYNSSETAAEPPSPSSKPQVVGSSSSGSPVRVHSRSQLQRTNSSMRARVNPNNTSMSSPRSESAMAASFATVPDLFYPPPNGSAADQTVGAAGGAAGGLGPVVVSAGGSQLATPLNEPLTPPMAPQPYAVPPAMLEFMARRQDSNSNAAGDSGAAAAQQTTAASEDDTRQLVEQFLQRHGSAKRRTQ